MPKLTSYLCVLGLAGLMATTPLLAAPQTGVLGGERPITFEAAAGTSVEAFEGSFEVPENRADPDSRTLTLKYIRFPATGEKKGSPIVYLAGGPGGSGIQTAKYERFPLFMAMREFGDVIAFDQRGTGASNDLPNCTSSHHVSATEPTSDRQYAAIQQAAFAQCLEFWDTQGIDVRGYTTMESVKDLTDLRRHLDAEKINLWGISYGSHLALAALKDTEARIGRVVMTAVEGLDQTVKQPTRSNAYFDRLQQAIDTVPEARAKYPDVKAMIARVLAKLEAEPLALQIPASDGSAAPFLLQKRDLQQFTAALAMDPSRVGLILAVYKGLDEGKSAALINLLQRAIDPADTAVAFRTMGTLMDVASGTGAERRAMLEQQGETALLGLQMNPTLFVETVDPSLDLGPEFRTAPVSNVPTLVLHGTLDGRTFPESGQEATAGLANRQTVTVTNGGHNLFMLSPEVTQTIQAFMRGESVDGREIVVDLPNF